MKNKKIYKDTSSYYLGLDIGTNSIGYAVTDAEYKLLKFRGEPMIGTHLLDEAETSAKRRGFRTARRRLDRRQMRVRLIRELFAKEIAKLDADFYKRMDSSAMFAEDKITQSANSFFNDENYKDKDYHRQYPTIHHLILDLMYSDNPHDVRLVYLAVSYLAAHRGHFLNEVDKDDVSGVLDFNAVYESLMNCFEEAPWHCQSTDELKAVLRTKCGVRLKEEKLIAVLFDGKKPKLNDGDKLDKMLLVKLLAGGKTKAEKIFLKSEYKDLSDISLGMPIEEFEARLSELEEDGEILMNLKKLYDWSLLVDLIPDEEPRVISKKKVMDYEKHHEDVKFLKYFIRKYESQIKARQKTKYSLFTEVFRAADVKCNYAAYVNNSKNSVIYQEENGKKKLIAHPIKNAAQKPEFSNYILSLVKDIYVDEEDKERYEKMIAELDPNVLEFMPKQSDGGNRVIPYQLYYTELKQILEKASTYLEFLNETDEDGISTCEKILSVFTFRIPYFVGPLNTGSEHAWIVRCAGKIYPWNFDKLVDLEASEEAFIKRMTNSCTYLPGEDVLPKNSLLYEKFEVLNEINNIKVNGKPISIEDKQGIFCEKFMKLRNVKKSDIEKYLIAKSSMIKGSDELSGIDEKINAQLKAYHFFKVYFENGILTEADAEEILRKKAYSEDSTAFRKWLRKSFAQLSDADCKKIASQKFKEFGRLSRELLCNIYGTKKSEPSGEAYNVIGALWETNCNLMQLIMTDEFTFKETIENKAEEYYSENPLKLEDRLDEMYVPYKVKRPIIRTMDVVEDIVKAKKAAPAKIFVEVARGATDEQKNKRTVSRRNQILEFYKSLEKTEEIKELLAQLESIKDDAALQNDKLYLYFVQCGRSMYSGEAIDIDMLGSGVYDIDHIYPRHFVKDDSITANKVLVLAQENRDKSDKYPISTDIQNKMKGFWHHLHDKGAISDEKYRRLVRTTAFDAEEKWGFINRQLVETSQAVKAVAQLLKELFPNTEIKYVKAGLVSDFRHSFDILKCRSVNDLHHAKDAYLNIVVGNVYYSYFKNKFIVNESYTADPSEIFKKTIYSADKKPAWNGSKSVGYIKGILAKNNIHLTRYAVCAQGGFFDQNPIRASESDALIPRKSGMDTRKYGGYNMPTASYFMLVKFIGKKTDLVFVPVELMHADKFEKSPSFRDEYILKTLKSIKGELPKKYELPLGFRKIKINTVFELDGFRVFLSSKMNKGRTLGVSSLSSLKLDYVWEKYIKRLESFCTKKKDNPTFKVNSEYDKITRYENTELYSILADKAKSKFFKKLPCADFADGLANGAAAFEGMDTEKQCATLLNIISLFKECRKTGVDLSDFGSTKASAVLTLSSSVSNWKKKYQTAYILDSSASGIYERKSENLFELI